MEKRECDRELKPETLTVLDKPNDHYRVLILSGGMCDGGPLTFKIHRYYITGLVGDVGRCIITTR